MSKSSKPKRNGRWSVADKFYLENNSHLSDKELAFVLGRTTAAIQQQRFRYMPNAAKKMPRWSSAEVETLKSMYTTHTDQEIADILGRTQVAVWGKRQRLKIGNSGPGPYTKGLEQKVSFKKKLASLIGIK